MKLLVVADRGLYREGLLAMFRKQPGFAVVGASARYATRASERLSPNVALLDICMREEPVLSVARRLRQQKPKTRMLMVDCDVRPANLKAVLGLGAAGYWTREAPFRSLLSAVESVAQGETSFCPKAEQHVKLTRRGAKFNKPSEPSGLEELTRREHEVFVLLAGGMAVRQCAEHLGLAANTVDNHKSHLMRKLGVHKTTDLVRLAAQRD